MNFKRTKTKGWLKLTVKKKTTKKKPAKKKTVKPKKTRPEKITGPALVGPVAGTCQVCGCTEDRACEGGCEWQNKEKTLCSKCELPVTEQESPTQPVEEQGPSTSIADKLAALLYYDETKTIPGMVSFEHLSRVQAQLYVFKSGKIFEMLGKLNMVVVDQKDQRLSPDGRLHQQAHIEGVILDFMKNLNVRKTGKHKTKQKMINPEFFPAGELAWKIIERPYEEAE